jgi:alanine racemase
MLRAGLNGVECGAVVKADGYGLGMARVARRLAAEGCRSFFVACVDEAVALRDLLREQDASDATTTATNAAIYVFDGLPRGGETLFDRYALSPVLGDLDQISRWAAHGRAHGGRRAVIKIDTGMARLGLTRTDVDTLADAPELLDGLTLDYVLSHLACADEDDNPMNAAQLATFQERRAKLPRARASLANSAGISLGPEYHFDLVRPGAALYGISSSPNRPSEMKQTVNLKGKIVHLRDVDSDLTVGYGATHRVNKGKRLATVAMGYADGFPRALGNRGTGFVGDAKVSVVGRVSMDLVTFDVTGAPDELLVPGGEVELIGPRHGVDDLAREAGTIGYEILSGLGARVRRVYVGEADQA